ncbi:MAG: SUMF1/EgtB/PvdO family nonheme iron enzyme [Planctomycetia bacterium]|nr:SUMF1/EgtB/PvdO family nonheme iron enzyme [Planctomycetia bacterium]
MLKTAERRLSCPRRWRLGAAAWCLGLACGVLGRNWADPRLVYAGAVVVCLGVVLLFARRRGVLAEVEQPDEAQAGPAPRPVPAGGHGDPADPGDIDGLVEQMLAQYRFALLLRPQIAGNLNARQFARAMGALEEQMALVPDGEVALGQMDETLYEGMVEEEELPVREARVVRVQRFFLDRFSVTNRQFFEFVAAGGYRQAGLWEASILPAMLDFVDLTGEPGPRFWKNGCYLEGREDHPVVGVSWHEAAAYARWVGKRLPTDAEWVKAASWPVPTSQTERFQRRYPWGETMDRARANLWGSGAERTVAVREFAEGVSVGGVYQLVGNVWEWTHANFHGGAGGDDLILETPMKSLRGGAFDTYFDSQAACQFQSGDSPLARKRNIGFRLAVGLCDLTLAIPPAPRRSGSAPEATHEQDQDVVVAEDVAEDVAEAEEVGV